MIVIAALVGAFIGGYFGGWVGSGADFSGTPGGQLSRAAIEQAAAKCRWQTVTGEFLPSSTSEQQVHGCTYYSDGNYDPFHTGSIRYNLTTQTTYYDSCTPSNTSNSSASFTEYYCQNSYTMMSVSGSCTYCAGNGACAGNFTATSAGQMTVYSCTWIGDNNNPLTPGSVLAVQITGTTVKTETCSINTSILTEHSCDYSGSPTKAVTTTGTCTLGCNTTAGNQASCFKSKRILVCDSTPAPSK